MSMNTTEMNGSGLRTDDAGTVATTAGRFRKPGVRLGGRIAMALAGALLLPMLAASCNSYGGGGSIPSDALVSKPSGTLSEGDEIKVTFPSASELNLSSKIQRNGKVNLPLVGDVSAAGKSITSFQSQLVSLYSSHLTDPQVFVSMEKPAASVYVSGEVRAPGKVALDRPMTVLEAVMESGGFSKLANPKKVLVMRNENGKQRRYVLNLKEVMMNDQSQAFYVRPYDVIYVDQSNW